MKVDAERVIADLRELARRTSDERGAQRLAWGPAWRQAREFLGELLSELGIEPRRDRAGNLWARLDGAEGPAVAVGSHLDSVPDGGWLDGALGVMAGVGVLRAARESGESPARPLVLVDWADEEGARFGRSLLGSSAWAGTLDPAELAEARDAEGRAAADLLAENGVELAALTDAADHGEGAIPELAAYLELHIEQGPVLEAEGLPVAAVAGCAGVERHRFRFRGQASHAGTTPMGARRDAGLAAAETALAVERIASDAGGVGTTGALALEPDIPTAIPGLAELAVDLRHPQAGELERMLAAASAAAEEAAGGRSCELEREPIWAIEPIPFDRELVAVGLEESRAAGGRAEPLTSGALHDAAEVARRTAAAMLFCPSTAGLSHAAGEDTGEEELTVAIGVFGRVVERVISGLSA
jgi:N-carbamoyl-L-amino-acid hydrolase